MRKISLAIVLLLSLVGSVRADSMDDAEAKRRGVSVQQVQLEAAQAKLGQAAIDSAKLQDQIKTLQAQVKDLTAKAAAAQAAADAASAELAKLKSPSPDQKAKGEVAVGMAKADIPAKFKTVSTNNNSETMEWAEYGASKPGESTKVTTWTVSLFNGVVTNVASNVSFLPYRSTSTPPVRTPARGR